jgi:LysM repeat protein
MGMSDTASPEYALTTIVNGLSSTDLALSFGTVFTTPHSIEIHKSSDQIGFQIACADLKPPQTMQSSQAMQSPRMMTSNLVSENDSGVTGTASVMDLGGGSVRIMIHAVGTGSEPRPAHVHEGQCMHDSDSMDASMGMGMGMDVPAPEYALTTLVNGDSTTDLNVSLSELLKTPHAIHIHKSADQIGFHIACVDLQSLKMTYTVADGDTLSDIARQFYGDGDRWPAIFAANRGLIANPNKIFRGQVLTIQP